MTFDTGKIVDGLKSNPSCLAVIVLAAIFAGLTFWAMQREADRQQQRLTAVYDLLNRCTLGKEGNPP